MGAQSITSSDLASPLYSRLRAARPRYGREHRPVWLTIAVLNSVHRQDRTTKTDRDEEFIPVVSMIASPKGEDNWPYNIIDRLIQLATDNFFDRAQRPLPYDEAVAKV